MFRYRLLIAVAGSLAFGGCATTSFAPPEVALPKRDAPLFGDAIADVDAFISKYRSSARSTVNGRQYFEVPAFLGVVGSVTSVAFGASPDVTIASGAAGALLNGGKSYYAPRDKAVMYSSALKALYCIQQTALGVKPFVEAASGTEAFAMAESANGSSSAYYYLVRNAALSVEDILLGRLSNAGSVTDAAGIAAEYEKQVKDLVKKRADAKATLGGNAKARGLAFAGTMSEEDLARLNALQPQLQLCVLIAKS